MSHSSCMSYTSARPGSSWPRSSSTSRWSRTWRIRFGTALAAPGHDPQARLRRLSALLEQGEFEDRPAAQSRNVQLARGGREARARGAVLQASRRMIMASAKQRAAARRNIGKAAKAARKKRTISRLPKRTRTALGKQAAKVAKRRRKKKIGV